jgi:AcrR family transcriptional regulator
MAGMTVSSGVITPSGGNLKRGPFRVFLLESKEEASCSQDRVHDKIGQRRPTGGTLTGRLSGPKGRYGGRSAEERQAERRRRFLDAALRLFGDTPGYRSTTVAALSEAAGLSTRQFYEEFRNLEDVLAALHLQVNDWAERAVLKAAAEAEGLPVEDRAARIFRAYAADVTGDPRRIRITFVEIVGVSPRLERQRLARRSRWVDIICAEATAAADRGEAVVRDYRLAATAFIGSVNGLLHDWSAGWVPATLDEVVDELVRQLLGILRPSGWPGDG